jgi:hypothetical protein
MMQTVKVNRTELLTKLRANREQHQALFNEAFENYRKFMLEELEQRINEVKVGKKIDHYIRLEAPQDHTEDYDRIILMAEMSLTDEIELTQQHFGWYVMDQWQWKNDFMDNATTYTAGAPVYTR